MQSEYLSRKELADRLGKSVRTLHRWELLLEGAILRAGHATLYHLPVVLQILKQRGSSFLGASPQGEQNKRKKSPQKKQKQRKK